MSTAHLAVCRAGCRVHPSREELRRNHGTPEEFEDAVLKAMGEISMAEAREAIRAYRLEWSIAEASGVT